MGEAKRRAEAQDWQEREQLREKREAEDRALAVRTVEALESIAQSLWAAVRIRS